MPETNIHRLTNGNIFWNLIRFALPFLGANILMSLYGTADIFIVSQFANAAALSATATGAQAVFTVMALAMGLNMGGTILIGQYFGAHQEKDVRQTTQTLFSLILKIGIASSVILFLLADSLTQWLQTPPEAQRDTYRYISICGGGIIFTFFYEAISAVLKGLGDSKTPLKFIAISCLINILLDILFVAGFHWGATGAAIATVMAQMFSVVIAIIYLKKGDFLFDFKPKSFQSYPDKVKMILKVGIPAAIQHTIVFASFTVMTIVINRFGVIESAVLGITNRIDGFLILPALAFSSAISVMTAQNMGAGNIRRAEKSFFCGFLLSLIVAVPAFSVMYYHPEFFMDLVSSDPEIISAGGIFMLAYSPESLLLALMFCMNGFFNGCGRTTFTMLNNSISSIFLRIPLILLATDLFTVGLTMPFSTFPQILITLIYFAMGRWKKSLIR